MFIPGADSSGGGDLFQVLLGVLGGGGILSAVAAFFKLKPDANSAAVTQSQGAMETMALLNRDLEDERNTWRARALKAEGDLVELERQVAAIDRRTHRHVRRTD